MRKIIFIFLLGNAIVFAQTKKAITLDDIWLNGTFSGKNVGGFNFMKEGNNLYLYKLDQAMEIQITNDGKKNNIINGNCDWVYEEEFEFSKAFKWNSNGTAIAYYKFDETNVLEYSMPVYGKLYPENN